jgi:hypothetical protein
MVFEPDEASEGPEPPDDEPPPPPRPEARPSLKIVK